MNKWYLTRGYACLVLALGMTWAEAATAAEKPPNSVVKNSKLTVRAYMAKIEKFKSSSASMEPQEAAKQWLGLVDDFLSVTTTSFEVSEKTDHLAHSSYQVITALPPSSMWDAIVAELKTRHEAQPQDLKALSLLMLLAVLQNDMSAWEGYRTQLVARVQQSEKLSEDSKEVYGQHVDGWNDTVVELSGNAGAQAQKFLKAMASWEGLEQPVPFATIPNLASELTPERVFEVLAKVFQSSDASYINDEATLEMAKHGFKTHPEFVPKPSWYWVSEPRDKAIYEKLHERFPEEDEEGAKREAFPPYLLGLIAEGDVAAAEAAFTQWMRTHGENADLGFMADAVKSHPSKALFEFLDAELQANPPLPWWGEYTDLALVTNQRVPAMERLMQTRAMSALDESVYLVVELCYIKFLLSVGQMDSGAELLTQVLKDYESSELVDSSLGLHLATIGRLMKETSWEKAGLDFIQHHWKADFDAEFAWDKPKHDAVIAMIQQGQMKVAEAYVERVIQHFVQGKEDGLDQEAVPRLLSLLAYLQLKTDRFEEVVQLFDEAANWGVHDVRDLEVPAILGHSVQGILVEALIKTDRKALAERIVEAFLSQQPNHDEAYRWWVELKGKDALAAFEALQVKHPHLSKPVSWIAHVQHQHGEDASEKIKQALALNPLDELALATQADALEKQAKLLVGDSSGAPLEDAVKQKQVALLDEAKRLRLKVAAQLLGREAQEVFEVHLGYEALQRFERAFEMDPENGELAALAGLAAASIGETERARANFEQSFRRLPKSLSRFESVSQTELYEALFAQPLALEVGNKVLSEMAENSPESATSAYVLGRLNMGQLEVQGALDAFQRAMELDPEWAMPYKYALQLPQVWNKLSFRQFLAFADEQGRIQAPFAKLDAWRLKFAKLDPWDQVGGFSALSDTVDLKGVWDTILELDPVFENSVLLEPLYPLSGTLAAYLEEHPEYDPTQHRSALRPSKEQLYEAFGEHQRVASVLAPILEMSNEKL